MILDLSNRPFTRAAKNQRNMGLARERGGAALTQLLTVKAGSANFCNRRAAFYRLDSSVKLLRSGPVAQLGERLNGIQEVVGSIPIGSTEI